LVVATIAPLRASADAKIPAAGEKLIEQKRYREAVAFFDRYLQQHSSDANGFLGRGMANADLRQDRAAINDLTRSISLSPTAKAYAARGQVLVHQRAIKQALSDFEQATRLEPKDAYYFDRLGGVLYGLHRWDESAEWMGKACAIDPRNATYWTNRSRAAEKGGDEQSAIKYALQAVSLSSKEDRAYEYLAQCSLKKKDYKQAIEYAQKGLAAGGKCDDCITAVAEAYTQMKQPEKAVEFLTAKLKALPLILPRDRGLLFKMYTDRARAYYAMGKYPQALADYTHVAEKLRAEGGDGDIYTERGVLLKKMGRQKEAAADFEMAASIEHAQVNDYSTDPLMNGHM
jgi:tetratricopeptide (TPR) repeat protein